MSAAPKLDRKKDFAEVFSLGGDGTAFTQFGNRFDATGEYLGKVDGYNPRVHDEKPKRRPKQNVEVRKGNTPSAEEARKLQERERKRKQRERQKILAEAESALVDPDAE